MDLKQTKPIHLKCPKCGHDFACNGNHIEEEYYSLKVKANSIKAKMAEYIEKRNDKQPLNFPNAGSTFKRPEGYFAGQLIEECGLRGKTIGGAQVSEKHCGFIINKNNATSADIADLIEFVRDEVLEQKGIFLETEVKFV